MSTITDVRLTKNATTAEIPARGFYIDLDYMYGDADGDKTVTAGPFPEDKKYLLIEFLNVLEAMLAEYPHGKGGFDDYEGVPGYSRWFDCDGHDDEDDEADPDNEIRESLTQDVECVPDGYGGPATFTGYKCYWHDGTSTTRYEVIPVRDPSAGE